MNVGRLLAKAHARGIKTEVRETRLHIRGVRSALTPRMRKLLAQYKSELVQLLTREPYPLDMELETSKNIGKRKVSYPRAPKNGP